MIQSIVSSINLISKAKKGFITGGAGGIGRNVAAAWLESGAEVALVDIESQKEKLEPIVDELNERYPNRVTALYCDVSNPKSVEKLKKQFVTNI
ncbi:SDR family NAD(P)-dependent oxidoreductase [Aerococcaceae bacterium DSM 111020]|nr:SDR family NAD(P)-dependent oxidoreductase [Aerococcaceae bacterium DSM 111020]